jgi:amino acid transporter
VPKTGSAYVYTYVTIGEFMAFVIGWNLILEYVIGTSSVARAFSTYFDSLIDNSIQNFFKEHMPMHISGLSPYPDFFAFLITLIITGILALGVKESSRMNNIFTGVNLCIVTFIIVAGSFKANFHNWSLTPSELPTNWTNGTTPLPCNTTVTCGHGGFFAFGVSGMLAGAAKCFYAFVGFDCIATTGEEVQNPQRAIPISIILALLVCTIGYCGVSAVLSLMVPYFAINENAPMPEAFRSVGWTWARYLVAIGAICSLSTSLLGAMFPLPRVLYAIASDGLIFRWLSNINDRFKTPLGATILSGLFAGFMAMIFDLDELVNMMSIGTLLAYSLVAISVLVLRYQADNSTNERTRLRSSSSSDDDIDESFLKRLFAPSIRSPTSKSAYLVSVMSSLCGK